MSKSMPCWNESTKKSQECKKERGSPDRRHRKTLVSDRRSLEERALHAIVPGARSWQSARYFRRRHRDHRSSALERIRRRLARTSARRHPHRTRELHLLLTDRHVHYLKRCPIPDHVVLPPLTVTAVAMSPPSRKQQLLDQH